MEYPNLLITTQYYLSWIVMVISAIWISYEVYRWSNFLLGLKGWFFKSLIGLLWIYAIYNGSLIIYGIIGYVYYTEYFLIKDPSWIGVQRMYSHAIFPFILACIMRMVNYRSHRASTEERNIIYQAGTIIARSKKERARAELSELAWEAHFSK